MRSGFRIALLLAPLLLGSAAARADVMVGEKTSNFWWGLSTTCTSCQVDGSGAPGIENYNGPYEDPVLIGGSRAVLGTAHVVASPSQAAIGLHATAALFGGGTPPPATTSAPPYVHATANNSNDPIVGSVGTASGASARLQWFFAVVPKSADPLAGGPIAIDIQFSMGATAICTTQLASCLAEAHTSFRASAPSILQTPPIEEALDVNYSGPGDDSELFLPPTTRTLSTYASPGGPYWNVIDTEARVVTSLTEGEASAEAFVDPSFDFNDPADAADFDILVSSGIEPTAVPEPGAALLGLASGASLYLRRRMRA